MRNRCYLLLVPTRFYSCAFKVYTCLGFASFRTEVREHEVNISENDLYSEVDADD